MIGLALVGLLVLRSMVRGSPTAVETAKSDAGAAGANDEPTEAVARTAGNASTPPAPSFREELSAMVEDDPETAANILRNWIGQVGLEHERGNATDMYDAGIRKAAILVASLDQSAADLLLDNWAPSAPSWSARP